MMNEDVEYSRHRSGGGGIISLIILILVGWWVYGQFIKTDYSKPWWSGTTSQYICTAHTQEKNCYYLPITVEEGQVVQIGFLDGGYTTVTSSECDKAISFNGRYCVLSDIQNRTWQVEKYE